VKVEKTEKKESKGVYAKKNITKIPYGGFPSLYLLISQNRYWSICAIVGQFLRPGRI